MAASFTWVLKLRGQRLEGEEVRQRIQECLFDEQLQVIVDIARFQGQDTDTLVAYLARESAPRAGTALRWASACNLVMPSKPSGTRAFASRRPVSSST